MHINMFKQSIGYGDEYYLKHSDMLYDEFFIVTTDMTGTGVPMM
jgi:hypothetical protein